MAKKAVDIQTAAENDSFRIRVNSLAPRLRRQFSQFSKIERYFYMTVVFAVILVTLALVYVRIRILTVQTSTHEISFAMQSDETQLTLYNQNLQDLTSQGKIGNAATQAGLSLNNSKVITLKK